MAQDHFMSYSMPLEIYFDSALVRGILETNQDRLSNHLILREGDEAISLRDATLRDLAGKPLGVNGTNYLVYMHQVSLIADLSPQLRPSRAGFEHLYVKKDPNRAVLGIGRYWIEGNIHLTPGASVHDLLMARTHFIPVTEAVFLDNKDAPARTLLLNRMRINCVTIPNAG
jgi:hypothetical protein